MNSPNQPTVTVSGDLGSGKSSVTKRLAQELQLPRVSTGELQRQHATKLGLSTLDLNRRAEVDRSIDDFIDTSLKILAKSGDPNVVDSRMAWFFIPNSFKVYLVVDPNIAAHRVLDRNQSHHGEEYKELKEAAARLRARQDSERRRFKALYGVDIGRLRNYDLVLDTSQASLQLSVKVLLETLRAQEWGSPSLELAPKRLFPTEHVKGLLTQPASEANGDDNPTAPITVASSRGNFYLLDGHQRASAALLAEEPLISGVLKAEAEEPAVGSMTADEYAREATPSLIHDWEAVHRFRFASYPPTLDDDIPHLEQK